ncbi:hypothetical protein Bca101_094290 [Brassica carinata]
MAKTTILAIFMIVLVLGVAMKETQGQENCHEYYTETGICEHNQCAAQCASKRNGTGRFNCDIDWFVRMDWHVYSGGGKREGGGYRGGSHGGSCGGYRCESCSGYGYGGDGYVNRYSGGRGGYSRVGGGG